MSYLSPARARIGHQSASPPTEGASHAEYIYGTNYLRRGKVHHWGSSVLTISAYPVSHHLHDSLVGFSPAHDVDDVHGQRLGQDRAVQHTERLGLEVGFGGKVPAHGRMAEDGPVDVVDDVREEGGALARLGEGLEDRGYLVGGGVRSGHCWAGG